MLKEWYEKAKALGVEIVFVSSDQDKDAMESYFKDHGDYLAVPYDQRDVKQQLDSEFQIEGIPTLVVCKPDGTVVNPEANDEIEKDV